MTANMVDYLRYFFRIIIGIPYLVLNNFIPFLFETPLDDTINILGFISFPNPFAGMPLIYTLSMAGFTIIFMTRLRHFLFI